MTYFAEPATCPKSVSCAGTLRDVWPMEQDDAAVAWLVMVGLGYLVWGFQPLAQTPSAFNPAEQGPRVRSLKSRLRRQVAFRPEDLAASLKLEGGIFYILGPGPFPIPIPQHPTPYLALESCNPKFRAVPSRHSG